MNKLYLIHSVKGSTWEKKDHKYIKKENGVYYYETKNASRPSKDISTVSKTETKYDEDYLTELAKKDPSEMTDEEINALYQFPDKVKANVQEEKDTALARKGQEIVERVLDETKKLLKKSTEVPGL